MAFILPRIRSAETVLTMYRIERGSEVHHTVNHSRFLGFAVPCCDDRELRAHLVEIANRHPDAHHLAFAYRIKTGNSLIAHCNDAGEPGGTAGRPILTRIEGADTVNALVAVVRYFGGVKLGAGGLVRAYGGTAKRALEAATLVPYVELAELRLTTDYSRLQPLTYHLEKKGGEILSKSFGAQVDLIVRLPASEAADFQNRFGGKM